MNRKYMQAEIEIIMLHNEDVITTSGEQPEFGGIDQGGDAL